MPRIQEDHRGDKPQHICRRERDDDVSEPARGEQRLNIANGPAAKMRQASCVERKVGGPAGAIKTESHD